jgi:hypothetical protein
LFDSLFPGTSTTSTEYPSVSERGVEGYLVPSSALGTLAEKLWIHCSYEAPQQ